MDTETKQATLQEMDKTGRKLYSISVQVGHFHLFGGYWNTPAECKAAYIELYTAVFGKAPNDADRYDEDFTKALLDESSSG